MPELNRWKIEKKALVDMTMARYNPRDIDEVSLARLEYSLKRFGYVEPIVWNKTTGNIVGGHQRYKILSEEGVEEAHVMVVEFDDDEEVWANLTLNNPETEGDWDDPVEELLEQVRSDDNELYDCLGFDELHKTLQKPQTDNEPVGDTVCPCCNHSWDLSEADITLAYD